MDVGRTDSLKFFIRCDSASDLAPVSHVSLYVSVQIQQGDLSILGLPAEADTFAATLIVDAGNVSSVPAVRAAEVFLTASACVRSVRGGAKHASRL